MRRKNKTFFGVFGVILLILGVTGTIPIALKGEEYFIWLPFTAIAVIAGVLLIAWAFGK